MIKYRKLYITILRSFQPARSPRRSKQVKLEMCDHLLFGECHQALPIVENLQELASCPRPHSLSVDPVGLERESSQDLFSPAQKPLPSKEIAQGPDTVCLK